MKPAYTALPLAIVAVLMFIALQWAASAVCLTGAVIAWQLCRLSVQIRTAADDLSYVRMYVRWRIQRDAQAIQQTRR